MFSKSGFDIAMLRRNALCAFESRLITSDKMFIFVDGYEYILLKFSDNLDQVAN